MSSQQRTTPPARLEIVKGPWTPVAKQQALEREVLGHYIEYFNRAMKTRNWSPWHDFSLTEMRQFGERLSKETVNLLEGFLGVEEYVADYVMAGLELFRHNRTRRNMQLQWGAEESRHGVAWEIVLQHSGVRTEAEIQAYLTKVQAARWKLEQHSGLDTPASEARSTPWFRSARPISTIKKCGRAFVKNTACRSRLRSKRRRVAARL